MGLGGAANTESESMRGEVTRQDECGGCRQVAVQDLVAWYEDHGLPFPQDYVVLACVGGGVEDVHGDAMGEAFLKRSRSPPQQMQLSDGNAGLLQQFATGGLL